MNTSYKNVEENGNQGGNSILIKALLYNIMKIHAYKVDNSMNKQQRVCESEYTQLHDQIVFRMCIKIKCR